jgi:hypothetical protein
MKLAMSIAAIHSTAFGIIAPDLTLPILRARHDETAGSNSITNLVARCGAPFVWSG